MNIVLTSLKMKNFRYFKNLKTDLHYPVSVVTGDDDFKSAVVGASVIAAGSFVNYMRRESCDNIHETDVFERNAQKQYPAKITAYGNVDGTNIVWNCSFDENGKNTVSRDVLYVAGACRKNLLKKTDRDLILPAVFYYNAGDFSCFVKSTAEENVSLHDARMNGYTNCLDGSFDCSLMMKWFRKMERKRIRNKKADVKLLSVYETIESCFKKFFLCSDVKIKYNSRMDDLRVVSDDLYINDFFSLDLTPEYRFIAGLIADISCRMAVLNPQLSKHITETPGIVVINNIDCAVFTGGRNRILKALTETFPNIQFIVSTDSLEIAESVSESMIVTGSA